MRTRNHYKSQKYLRVRVSEYQSTRIVSNHILRESRFSASPWQRISMTTHPHDMARCEPIIQRNTRCDRLYNYNGGYVSQCDTCALAVRQERPVTANYSRECLNPCMLADDNRYCEGESESESICKRSGVFEQTIKSYKSWLSCAEEGNPQLCHITLA